MSYSYLAAKDIMMSTATGETFTVDIEELDSNTRLRVDQVRDSGSTLLIIEGGEPAAVLVDAEEYSKQQFRILLMDRITRATRDFSEGRFYTEEQVDALMDEWAEQDA